MGFAEPERLTPEASAEERLLLGLRTHEGVAFGDLAALSLHPEHPRVGELRQDGLLEVTARGFSATRRGRAVLDAVTRRLALA